MYSDCALEDRNWYTTTCLLEVRNELRRTNKNRLIILHRHDNAICHWAGQTIGFSSSKNVEFTRFMTSSFCRLKQLLKHSWDYSQKCLENWLERTKKFSFFYIVCGNCSSSLRVKSFTNVKRCTYENFLQRVYRLVDDRYTVDFPNFIAYVQSGLPMDHPTVHYPSDYTFPVFVHFKRYALQKKLPLPVETE